MVLALVGSDLPSNLAAGTRRSVHVRIGLPGANRGEQLCEVPCFELLRRQGQHVARREIALNGCRRGRACRTTATTAEENRDAAVDIRLPHMNMSRPDRGLQPAVTQNKVD